MPKAFEDCIRNGGEVRTIAIGKEEYRHICILNGKTFLGEIKKKKSITMNKKEK